MATKLRFTFYQSGPDDYNTSKTVDVDSLKTAKDILNELHPHGAVTFNTFDGKRVYISGKYLRFAEIVSSDELP